VITLTIKTPTMRLSLVIPDDAASGKTMLLADEPARELDEQVLRQIAGGRHAIL
jgi:hypothetical protein